MSYNNMTPDALAIADHMNQYIAGNNIECAARLEQIKYNPKIENKLDYEQWDLVIDYVYQNLLAVNKDIIKSIHIFLCLYILR